MSAPASVPAPAGIADPTVSIAARPRRYGSWYVAEHRIRSMRYYLQTMLATTFGSPVLYLLGLGVGLAGLVDARVADAPGQTVSYLTFVAPALLASAAVTVATEEATYPVMMSFKWNPIFVAMRSSPVTPHQIVNGMVISIAARLLPTIVIYYGFIVLFDAVPSGWGALSIVSATLTGVVVALVLMSYSSTVTEDKGQMAMLMRFGVTPMFLFSGTFFPLAQLPLYLQWIGWISPLWHGAQIGRVFSYGLAEPVWLTVIHFVFLIVLGLVCWRSTQRTFARRLDQ